MIQLTCPHCRADLEIDEGFRGGICRCFSCGTLMTVPEEHGAGRPESLGPPRPRRAQQAAEIERPQESQALVPAGATEDDTDELATYVTASGQQLHISRSQLYQLPVARRRGVRIGVTAAMGLIAALMVGGVVWFAIWLFSAPVQPTVQDIYADLFDITLNPYLATEPNFMGLPVANRTVYMIDSSAAMRSQFDLIAQAAARSLATLPPHRSVQVVLWTEVAPTVFPEAPTAVRQIDAQTLMHRLESVFVSGAPLPVPAFVRALRDKPAQITLVCRTLPHEAAADLIAEHLKASDTKLLIVQLDAIENDPDTERWRRIAHATGGGYFTLNTGRLQRWYEQYLDQRADE